MKRILWLVCAALAVAMPCLQAQEAVSQELKELRALVAEQQRQIDELRALVKTLVPVQAAASAPAAALTPGGAAATAPVASAVKPAVAPSAVPTGAPASAPAKAPLVAAAPKNETAPLSFRLGNAEFTPGGFMDMTAMWRSSNVGSGIATSFQSIPYGNTIQGKLGETRLSAQNSRLSLRVDSEVAGAKVRGYAETDFYGFIPTSMAAVSNSATLRLRLFFVDVQKSKYEFLAGQAWSLFTPNRTGVSPMPADLFIGIGQDSNYLVGLTWGRSGTFRGVWHPNKHWALAAAVEGAEQYIGPAVVLPAALASGITGANELNNGGTTLATPNPSPDFVTKVAYDNSRVHFELAGALRRFRIANPVTLQNYSATGYVSSFNSNILLGRGLRLIENAFYSDGGGRYIAGTGPDVIVRADGSLSPVRSMATLNGLEWNATKNTTFYAYYGGAYFARNLAVDTTGKLMGYGTMGNTAANRSIQEATFGWIRTFWKSPNYGSVQFISQYVYLWRNPWSVPAGLSSHAKTNMVYADIRYTLP